MPNINQTYRQTNIPRDRQTCRYTYIYRQTWFHTHRVCYFVKLAINRDRGGSIDSVYIHLAINIANIARVQVTSSVGINLDINPVSARSISHKLCKSGIS
ncbi:hypothetical protein LSH36_858g00090 [Paralvinella palmiformis]|uniref:Uncharacterized protein n=1 Tax=Paralvinella palmiformis TaxID=53620 RepID=A0AAD9MS04_9ANNE|nr:hypothetical protein LSH36_858g00090 [Paralvinella palmiformis]